VRKPSSTKKKLIVPTSIAFVTLVAAMIFTAYFQFFSSVTSSTNEQTLATSQQVLTNYESYFDSVITVSNNVLGRYSNADKTGIESSMASYFDTIETFKGEILSMSLYKKSDGSYLSGDSSTKQAGASVDEAWFSDAKANSLINIFSPVTTANPNVAYTFTLSRYLTYEKDRTLDAILKVDFDFAKIVDTISPATLGEGGRFIIYTKDYKTIYTSNTLSKPSRIPKKALVKDFVIGSETVNFENHRFYLYAATISNTSWRVAIFTNQDALSKAIARLLGSSLFVGIAVVAAFIAVLNIVANSITSPIKRLQKEMVEIESLNYQTSLQPEITGTSEVVELNRSFNQMMGRISELDRFHRFGKGRATQIRAQSPAEPNQPALPL
jgi:HAMP domain-containing protein